MNDLDNLRQSKQEAERARRRLIVTAGELQERLKPGTIASNAWSGVKDRSGEFADDAVEAVKARPVAVSAALTAFTLFLARGPIKSALNGLFHRDSDDDDHRVVTRLDTHDKDYDLTAPVAAGIVSEGASA
ncbi:MAG TPA: DUF3618 domain-containing protein [Allosphingosinicella sp.]